MQQHQHQDLNKATSCMGCNRFFAPGVILAPSRLTTPTPTIDEENGVVNWARFCAQCVSVVLGDWFYENVYKKEPIYSLLKERFQYFQQNTEKKQFFTALLVGSMFDWCPRPIHLRRFTTNWENDALVYPTNMPPPSFPFNLNTITDKDIELFNKALNTKPATICNQCGGKKLHVFKDLYKCENKHKEHKENGEREENESEVCSYCHHLLVNKYQWKNCPICEEPPHLCSNATHRGRERFRDGEQCPRTLARMFCTVCGKKINSKCDGKHQNQTPPRVLHVFCGECGERKWDPTSNDGKEYNPDGPCPNQERHVEREQCKAENCKHYTNGFPCEFCRAEKAPEPKQVSLPIRPARKTYRHDGPYGRPLQLGHQAAQQEEEARRWTALRLHSPTGNVQVGFTGTPLKQRIALKRWIKG
ncbi:hypothetical protein T439DRAFT_347946 [Meredithblackwellia eburnea MCA 4105]